MPLWLRAFAVVVALSTLSILIGIASARADEQCSGTLCDLYYGNAPAKEQKPTAQPAAPTPITVPKNGLLGYFSNGGSAQNTARNSAPGDASGTPVSGSTSRVHIGGGGLLGMARGETPERCSGTICDFYYGGPPPEKPAQGAPGAAPQALSDAEPQAAPDEVVDEPRPSRGRQRVEFVEREQKPRCAPTPQDPWRCYR